MMFVRGAAVASRASPLQNSASAGASHAAALSLSDEKKIVAEEFTAALWIPD
jgi:hypothetical protein